jgi:hypothetical protein
VTLVDHVAKPGIRFNHKRGTIVLHVSSG